ncbi:hypothetical protein C3920_09685 [Novacetimonas pomaceti]|uniref:DUF4870 domain-containing protein n=3 Tax=Novacetimonas pomaceti TaxID=2021998 RepID=A0ABX5P163_9PROT|nr:hypothetical protein C3920_09685 [Novacetimonas pomaceti]
MDFNAHNGTGMPPSQGEDGGNSMVNIVYILYLIGFFIPGTSALGIILAYINRNDSREPYTSHFQFQISIFLTGLIYSVAGLLLYLFSIAITAISGGIGAVFFVFPLLLMLWWAGWTIYSIIRGLRALGRNEPIY